MNSNKSRKNTSRTTTRATGRSGMYRVQTAGRRAASAYFEKSGIRYGEKLSHTPFIVFHEGDSGAQVEIIDNVQDLIKLPNNTKVMGQWKGNDRSDYQQFTVGELKQHARANPARTCEVI